MKWFSAVYVALLASYTCRFCRRCTVQLAYDTTVVVVCVPILKKELHRTAYGVEYIYAGKTVYSTINSCKLVLAQREYRSRSKRTGGIQSTRQYNSTAVSGTAGTAQPRTHSSSYFLPVIANLMSLSQTTSFSRKVQTNKRTGEPGGGKSLRVPSISLHRKYCAVLRCLCSFTITHHVLLRSVTGVHGRIATSSLAVLSVEPVSPSLITKTPLGHLRLIFRRGGSYSKGVALRGRLR